MRKGVLVGNLAKEAVNVSMPDNQSAPKRYSVLCTEYTVPSTIRVLFQTTKWHSSTPPILWHRNIAVQRYSIRTSESYEATRNSMWTKPRLEMPFKTLNLGPPNHTPPTTRPKVKVTNPSAHHPDSRLADRISIGGVLSFAPFRSGRSVNFV